MRKFNKVISIEVDVDSIANRLAGIHAGSTFPHVELLVETIIGSALESGHISMIYNAMNGFTNDIDFTVGQVLNCTEKVYMYVADGNGKYSEEHVQMGICTILEINIYKRTDQIKVAYDHVLRDGTVNRQNRWVSKTDLEAIPPVDGPPALA